jgi:ABC-type Fe3+-siderophore transport system permease subunit
VSARKSAVIVGLLVILAAVMLISVSLGAVRIPLPEILKILLHRLGMYHATPNWPPTDESIIFQIRLPRVLGAALVGTALSTAGVLFQGLFRNPMADPYVIGTSAGAAFGATIAMLLPLSVVFFGFGLVPLAAFCGALASVLIVYRLARFGGKTPVVSMLLAGFVMSSFLTAIIMVLLTVSDRLSLKLHQVFSFLMGGISVAYWQQIVVIAPLVILGVLGARLLGTHLNAFATGEEGAAYLGINVEREKKIVLGLGSLLTACAVSLGGLIGFIGLIVPHAIRLVLGPDHRSLVPASALAGAIFLVLADLLARTLLAPTELPVGVLTALIGAPFFIYLLARSRREYAF